MKLNLLKRMFSLLQLTLEILLNLFRNIAIRSMPISILAGLPRSLVFPVLITIDRGLTTVFRGQGWLEEIQESSDNGIFNVKIGAKWNDFNISLFGRNLSDEKRATNASVVGEFVQNRPRTVGIDFSYEL